MSEVAGDEDLAEDFFGLCRAHISGYEREFCERKAEDVHGDKTEFLPNRCHSEAFELCLEQGDVDLGMMLMEVHRPVAELTETDASDGHGADRMVQDKECVECGGGQTYCSACIVPYR